MAVSSGGATLLGRRRRRLVPPQALAGQPAADPQHLQSAQHAAGGRAAGRLLPSERHVEERRVRRRRPADRLLEVQQLVLPLIDHLSLIGQLAGAAVDLRRVMKAGDVRRSRGRLCTASVDHWALTFAFARPPVLPCLSPSSRGRWTCPSTRKAAAATSTRTTAWCSTSQSRATTTSSRSGSPPGVQRIRSAAQTSAAVCRLCRRTQCSSATATRSGSCSECAGCSRVSRTASTS